MYKLLLLGTALIGLAGCATTTTNWHPQSENEMRQIIGETTLMVIDQYETYLKLWGEQTLRDSLKEPDNAKPTH